MFVAAVKAGLYGRSPSSACFASVVGAYYYVRIVKIMFFDAPRERFWPCPPKAGVIASARGPVRASSMRGVCRRRRSSAADAAAKSLF